MTFPVNGGSIKVFAKAAQYCLMLLCDILPSVFARGEMSSYVNKKMGSIGKRVIAA